MYVARVRSGVYGKSGISDMRLALVGNKTDTNSASGLDKTGQIAPLSRSNGDGVGLLARLDIGLSQCQIGRPNQKGIGKQNERTNQGTNRAITNRERYSEIDRKPLGKRTNQNRLSTITPENGFPINERARKIYE